MSGDLPAIGVAIVSFNSSDVILACLDSLFASSGVRLRVALADNASSDETVALVRDWSARRADVTFEERSADDGAAPAAALTVVHSPVNGGYAHGVNLGLAHLLRDRELDLFWVLNPDCEVAPDTARLYCEHGADGQFALMSGRTVYREGAGAIQTDGGRIDRWTGVCKSVNAGADPAAATLPDPRTLDYLTGANLVASRLFIERVGSMVEDYFLYYEEVDWAFCRGDLPLRLVPGAIVFHHGGTSIGSGSVTRRASAFANYFNYRNRIRFMRRHRTVGVPVAIAYAMAKAVQLAAQGARAEAAAVVRGTLGLSPPAAVRDRIAPGEARRLAFGTDTGTNVR